MPNKQDETTDLQKSTLVDSFAHKTRKTEASAPCILLDDSG